MPRAQHAEEEVVTGAREDQPEAANEAGIGHRRRRRDTTEVQSERSREEIDGYPSGWLRLAALDFALEGLHGKSLMLHRFSYPRVNMLTKAGDRSSRRHGQHQRHDPGDHPRKRL